MLRARQSLNALDQSLAIRVELEKLLALFGGLRIVCRKWRSEIVDRRVSIVNDLEQ